MAPFVLRQTFLICVIGTTAIVAAGLAHVDFLPPLSAQDDLEWPPTQAKKKWLLSWTGAESDADTDGESEVNRIITDRPHFSEASNLVGLGRVQVETGYSFFRDRSANTLTSTHSFPEPLLRVGILAEWFEFRLGYNYLIETTTMSGGANARNSGSDDVYVAAKLALAAQAGIFPEVAIFPQLRVPTGAPGITAGESLPGFNLAYSWVINPLIELECNTQLNRRRDDSEHFYTEFIQTANIEYDIGERIGAFTEWMCFIPSGSVVAQPQHYFHAGFVLFPTPNIQVDFHSAIGLNRDADDLAFTGMGLSIRR